MDIVQARKKAREKAEREAQARRLEEPTPVRPAEPAPPKKAQPPGPAKGKRKPKPPPAAPAPRPPAMKTPGKVSPGSAKPQAAPPLPAPLSEQDIFVDMSFGEDLPLPPEVDADFELAPLSPRAPEKPAAPKPAAPAAPKAAPPPRPQPQPAPPPPPKPAPASKPAPAARGPDPEPLGSIKDDFLELVSEDLYRREFGEDAQPDISEQLELLSFQLASETYAIRLTSVQQIIKMREITLVPRAPEYILGVISLRGTIIPIFDLRRRLGLARREPTRETRIIVVREGAKAIGLIVDRVRQVVRIPAAGIEPPPPVLGSLESEYLEGIGRSDGRLLILLHLEKVLAPPTMH